jgi:phosphatidate cytidylyltransferase
MTGAEKLAYVLLALLGGVFVLAIGSFLLADRVRRHPWDAIVEYGNRVLRADWLRLLILAAALQLGEVPTLLVFAVLSFFALREFVSLTPIKASDYRALLFAFYVAVPVNYVLVGLHWYSLFVIFIPVYVCLTLPVLSVLKADTERYLERMAKLQMGVMITVFCVSHAPALLMLEIPRFEGQMPLLLLYLLIVSRSADAVQWLVSLLWGRRAVFQGVVSGLTVEGVVASVILAAALGAGLVWMTPFSAWQSALMALLIGLAGFLGKLVVAAIKRSLWAARMPEDVGGTLRRIDALCFAAPLFFHLTRYFFAD